MRAEVGRQILVDRFELLVSEACDPLTMVEAVAVPGVLVHLQHDDRHEGMAVLAVLENQVAAGALREDLVEIHLQGLAARSARSRRPVLRGRPTARHRRGAQEQQDASLMKHTHQGVKTPSGGGDAGHQNGVHPPWRNLAGTFGSGFASLNRVFTYAKTAASSAASGTWSLCDSCNASQRAAVR